MSDANTPVHGDDTPEGAVGPSEDVVEVPQPAAEDQPKVADGYVSPSTTGERSSGLSLEDVAAEVIEGKWGNGQERRQALDDAGYDPNEVKEEVVRQLNVRSHGPNSPQEG